MFLYTCVNVGKLHLMLGLNSFCVNDLLNLHAIRMFARVIMYKPFK